MSTVHLRNFKIKSDWDKHILEITKSDNFIKYEFGVPGTMFDRILFINTNGILAIIGDYGNWIFCREYHPTSKGYVSPYYWIEKLQMFSCQKPMEFDHEATEKEIKAYLDGSHNYLDEPLTEEEREYLETCLYHVDDEISYVYYAHRENVGMFEDHERVPHKEKINGQLQVIFDAFNAICQRMEDEENGKC